MSLITIYKNAGLFQMHQLLELGFERARRNIDPNTHEEIITEYVIRGIQEVLDDPIVGNSFRYISVAPEYPLSSSTRHGKRRRRIDIRFEHSGSLPRPKYHIEAKRLKRPRFTMKQYAGKDGLQCFLSGEYSSGMRFGGMIGYIQSDKDRYWYSQMEIEFRHSKCQTIANLSKSIQLGRSIEVYQSEHRRANGESIVLNHILLPCHAP
jgi:hypothetical protein